MQKFDINHKQARNPPTKLTQKKLAEERYYSKLEKAFKDIKRQDYKESKRIAAIQLSIQKQQESQEVTLDSADQSVQQQKPGNPLTELEPNLKIVD